MKNSVAMLLFLFFFATGASAQTKHHVFILHSYSQEYPWTKSQHQSFVSNLENSFSSSTDFSVEYLDTKRMDLTYEYEALMLRYFQDKYKGYRPDIIYVTDDDALTFFLHHHTELFPDVPIVFSGVNNLKLYGTLYPDKFTGVYETKDILPNIELIHQLSPQTRDIWIVGDASGTYQSIESDIKQQVALHPKYRFHFVSSERLSDVIERLPDTKKTFVLMTTIGKWSDKNGNTLTIKDSVSALSKKRNLVLCSMEDAYMVGGVVGGYVTSAKEQGRTAASLAGRYLQGEPFKNIHSVFKSPNIYMFDRSALNSSRLVLSEYTARNATILHPEQGFFVRNENILINIIFILVSILFILFIFFFFLVREKNRRIALHSENYAILSADSNRCSDLFSLMENNLHIGYWEWQSGDDTIVYSDGLAMLFGSESGEQTDMESLILFIYPAHKALVQSAIQEVVRTGMAKTLHHKIVCQNGNIESVVHSIHAVPERESGRKTLVGMVQKLDA